MGLGGQNHAQATLPLKRSGTTIQEGGWDSGPVWTYEKYLVPLPALPPPR